MAVKEVHLDLTENQQEFFAAEFMDDFEAFRMEDSNLWAYLPEEGWSEELKSRVSRWLDDQGSASALEVRGIQNRNWNAEWEKSIQAIKAGGFIIKASWSDEETEDLEVITIDPKMSFGTGHHETTRLMLNLLRETGTQDSFVLDAGTGTGVLGIAALKLGASKVIAFDIDPLCTINGVENREINEIDESSLEFRTGEFDDVVSEKNFDVVLANINMNALISLLSGFSSIIKDDGYLLVSGLLASDESEFIREARTRDFESIRVEQENEWIAIHLLKVK